MTTNDRPNANDTALAVLRIAVGALFLLFGEYKVFGHHFAFGGGFEGWIHRFIEDGSYPFMTPVLSGFVLSHSRAIALLVAYGELAIGLSLILGFLSRLASAFGLVYMTALLFSANYPGPHARLWQYFGASLDHLVLLFCFAVFVIGEPQRSLSVVRLHRRRTANRP